MISAPLDEKIYEFGDFRLIPGEGLLLYKGAQMILGPKAFAVLVLLVEHHGHLVQKSDIIDRIWDDAFIEEGAVSKAVWFVRKSLGESSREKFIQTVPKSGYRFVAPVLVLNNPAKASAGTKMISTGYRLLDPLGNREIDQGFISPQEHSNGNGGSDTVATENTMVPEERPEPVPVMRPLFGRLAVYAGIAMVLLASAAFYLTLSGRNILGKGDASRIAVLPLKPLDVQTRDPICELGIAEQLILKLGADKKLSVRQLNAVRGYVDVSEDPVKIGKEQNVDYVLSSNYQVANGRIKVTSQLMDVATGKVEDTFNVERDAANLFSTENAIANEIGNRLLARFGSEAKEFRSKRGTDNEDAYRSYQQAMTLLDQQRPGSIQKAREYLDRAVEFDPNYARAWAGKAYSYSIMRMQGRPYEPEDLAEVYTRSMEAAKKALTIDPNLSEAYASLCENKFAYELNYVAAENDCKRAVVLDPNSRQAHWMYSILLRSRGQADDALAEIRTAMELDPASLYNQRAYANTLFYARRYEEAIEVYKRLFDLNPEAPATHLYLIRSLERTGHEAEALEVLIKLLELQNKDTATIERFRTAYASSGWPGVLNERIKTELEEKSPQYSVVAEYYGMLGDKDKAFKYLEKHLNSGKRGWMTMFFRVDPRFDTLRDDPRFDDVIRRIEGG